MNRRPDEAALSPRNGNDPPSFLSLSLSLSEICRRAEKGVNKGAKVAVIESK